MTLKKWLVITQQYAVIDPFFKDHGDSCWVMTNHFLRVMETPGSRTPQILAPTQDIRVKQYVSPSKKACWTLVGLASKDILNHLKTTISPEKGCSPACCTNSRTPLEQQFDEQVLTVTGLDL